MLVIKLRQKKYYGYGIIGNITRKLFSSSAKSAISNAAKSAVAQKVVNAVVNGATSATQKAVEGAVNEAIKTYVKPKLSKKRAAAEEVVVEPKKSKIDINNLINGAGIVFD